VAGPREAADLRLQRLPRRPEAEREERLDQGYRGIDALDVWIVRYSCSPPSLPLPVPWIWTTLCMKRLLSAWGWIVSTNHHLTLEASLRIFNELWHSLFHYHSLPIIGQTFLNHYDFRRAVNSTERKSLCGWGGACKLALITS